MDSLQGIPVEYKLDTFNMPRTGTTLCHPKIGYVDLTRNALDTLALNSPLGHLNGDNAYSPQIPDTKPKWHPKFNSYNCNIFRQNATNTIPHTSDDTRCYLTFSTSHNSISSQYLQPFTSLAAPKANPIFHAANKNLIPKIPFDYRQLLLHSTFIYP